MLATHRSVGSLSMPGKSLKKQQSETFGGSARRRNPSNLTSGPRPTSEFGWQLSLQGSSLETKGIIIEEEAPREIQDGSNAPSHSLQDGASKPTFVDPPYHSSFSSQPIHSGSDAVSSSPFTTKGLAEKYADKDIGWQLALQGQEIPHNLPPERSLARGNSNPYSGVDVTTRESPRPVHSSFSHSPNGTADSFQHLNLDEAAKIYSGFSTSEKSPNSHGVKALRAGPPPSYLPNNPFHAMIQAAEVAGASSHPLVDLEEKREVILPNLLEDLTPNNPSKDLLPPLQRKSEETVRDEELLGCEFCPKQVPVRRISQIPSCLHLVCHDCLLNHVKKQLFDSYFPVQCPMCVLLEDQSQDDPDNRVPINQGVVTMEIMQNFQALAPATFDIFQEFHISSQSSQVFCPQCRETMLVDRAQYLQQSIVTCPRQTCGHKWCKSCFKDMSSTAPSNANAVRHKCKPEKTVGVRACPECGYQGRRIAGDNLIPCRGVGCRVQFCFKCGGNIADSSHKSQDIPQRIQAHYNKCTRVTKDDKCTVQ